MFQIIYKLIKNKICTSGSHIQNLLIRKQDIQGTMHIIVLVFKRNQRHKSGTFLKHIRIRHWYLRGYLRFYKSRKDGRLALKL